MTTASDIMSKARDVERLAKQKMTEEYGVFLNDEIIAHIEDYCASIPPHYEWFTTRDPGRLESMLDSLRFVKSSLTDGVAARVDDVKVDVQDWQGGAAANFTENFLSPFGQIRLNQIGLVDELIVSLEASRKILTESRENILAIGDGTITALEGLDDGGTNWGMVLTVVGAVALVAGAAIGGSGVVIGLALIEAGAAIGSAAIAEASVQGDTVEDVVNSMYDSMSKLRKAINEEEDILARALSRDFTTVLANYDQLLPPRPDVADATAQDLSDFRLPAGL